MTDNFRSQFIRFAVEAGILTFGEFATKAGRISPYFFNAGQFNNGALLGKLAQFYAQTIIEAEEAGKLQFDMLYGPAYKGITLASATAIELARAHQRTVSFAYNRKEAKDHGEGGSLIGAPLAGRVLIIDDVISAGTSIRESTQLLKDNGATPAGVLIALDRQERSGTAEQIGQYSATQQIEQDLGLPVLAIATLDDLLAVLDVQNHTNIDAAHREHIAAYRSRYGVARAG